MPGLGSGPGEQPIGDSGEGISGSGTANSIAKFTDTDAIGDSRIIDDGEQVNIRLPDAADTVTQFSASNLNGNYNVVGNQSYNTGTPTFAVAQIFASRFDFSKEASVTCSVQEATFGSGLSTVDIEAADRVSFTTSAINIGTLPTSDPNVAGQLWNSLGVVMISNG